MSTTAKKRPYTIERCDRLPRYQHVIVWANSVEEACKLAIEGEEDGNGSTLDWDGMKDDFDSCGPTYIDGIAEGTYHDHYEAPKSRQRNVPAQFREPLAPQVQRMREMLEATTAFVELSTGSGARKQPPQRYIKANGDYDAEAIARDARALLAKVPS